MKARLGTPLAVALALVLLIATMAFSQQDAPGTSSPQEMPEWLDQMLATITSASNAINDNRFHELPVAWRISMPAKEIGIGSRVNLPFARDAEDSL